MSARFLYTLSFMTICVHIGKRCLYEVLWQYAYISLNVPLWTLWCDCLLTVRLLSVSHVSLSFKFYDNMCAYQWTMPLWSFMTVCVHIINPFTAVLAAPLLRKTTTIKVPNLKLLRLFHPSHERVKEIRSKRTILKLALNTEIRFVRLGPSNILFASAYVSTFPAENFTGWGSEGVKRAFMNFLSDLLRLWCLCKLWTNGSRFWYLWRTSWVDLLSRRKHHCVVHKIKGDPKQTSLADPLVGNGIKDWRQNFCCCQSPAWWCVRNQHFKVTQNMV